ncbi:Anthranilate synthase component 1 [uncultured archaeon]|nr:Anthranilate synthase component 1 [uncultured archaeon]
MIHEERLAMSISPVDLFSAVCERCDKAFLLESSDGPQKLARFSFVGFEPAKHIVLKEGKFSVNGKEREAGKNPLAMLKAEVGTDDDPHAGLTGGAVGYFSYEYTRYLEALKTDLADETGFPDFEFGIFEDVVVFDHHEGAVRYLHRGESRLERLKEMVMGASFSPEPMQMYNSKCNTSREKFCQNVEQAKKMIEAGEIFQVVLSKRYDVKYSGSLVPFYKKLKAINPSPYLYFLKFGERQVIGSSPENLVRVEGREITSFATLAGTRERGKDVQEDAKLEKELLMDEKERAEHLMLVDLTRNDVGKVAAAGSVQVPKLMEVHKFSHVQHIASQVSATLAEGKDAYDALASILPAGTVSGAPKVRAMQIIDELEGARRGPYAGAVGYFSANGNADFAISIRTLFANGKKAFIQTGAGIVYDSVPDKEFDETENKAKALLHAMGEDRYEAAIAGKR